MHGDNHARPHANCKVLRYETLRENTQMLGIRETVISDRVPRKRSSRNCFEFENDSEHGEFPATNRVTDYMSRR